MEPITLWSVELKEMQVIIIYNYFVGKLREPVVK